jgi:hypothetical protein
MKLKNYSGTQLHCSLISINSYNRQLVAGLTNGGLQIPLPPANTTHKQPPEDEGSQSGSEKSGEKAKTGKKKFFSGLFVSFLLK